MRAIKFRAWDHEHKYMLFNVQNAYDGMGVNEPGGYKGDWVSFDDFMNNRQYTLMECTGVKDKNGAEIYEGDIVRADNWRHIVISYGEQYHEEDWGGWFVYQGWNLELGSGYLDPVKWELEVIGNIYENPELRED